MTVLSGQSIIHRITHPERVFPKDTPDPNMLLEINPFEMESHKAFGMSYGITAAGYDIRVGKLPADYPRELWLFPSKFALVASFEWIRIPHDLQAIVHDKSTLARRGLALQNTVLEPGWFGHITLELSNHGQEPIVISHGMPIAQIVFHKLDAPTWYPYVGKYQNQSDEPTQAILEKPDD